MTKNHHPLCERGGAVLWLFRRVLVGFELAQLCGGSGWRGRFSSMLGALRFYVAPLHVDEKLSTVEVNVAPQEVLSPS